MVVVRSGGRRKCAFGLVWLFGVDLEVGTEIRRRVTKSSTSTRNGERDKCNDKNLCVKCEVRKYLPIALIACPDADEPEATEV